MIPSPQERISLPWHLGLVLFLIPGLLLGTGCREQTPSPSSSTASVSTPPEQRDKSAALVQRGNRFLSDDLGGEAVRVLEEARRLDPASTEAALALASAYRVEDRFAASKKTLEELLASGSAPLAQRVRAREALV